MLYTRSHASWYSVGIDVGASACWMSIVDPQGVVVRTPYQFNPVCVQSIHAAILEIKKAGKNAPSHIRIFMESTGNYPFQLSCYLQWKGFDVRIINSLITHSTMNMAIRKAKTDKIDSYRIALLGLHPDLKTSKPASPAWSSIRNLIRLYHDVKQNHGKAVSQLRNTLVAVFPQYLPVFSNIAGATSLAVLKTYDTPNKILQADSEELCQVLQTAARGHLKWVPGWCEKLHAAAADAVTLNGPDTAYWSLSIRFLIESIEAFNTQIKDITAALTALLKQHADTAWVKQNELVCSIPGTSPMTAATLLCEMGNIQRFKNAHQLVAYFGLDPSVSQLGRKKGDRQHISKRGSSLARKIIFMIAISNIRKKANGQATNPVLYAYYQERIKGKSKLIVIGAVMHKICNILFAVLHNGRPFVLETPEEHCKAYVAKYTRQAA